ncbi:MAG: YdeI/OmpD-associated family protein [Pseudomonadota bacterium]
MSFFDFEFEGVISRHTIHPKSGSGRSVTYTVLYLPDHFVDCLPFVKFPRLRIDGEVSDLPVNGAWQPAGNRIYYFMIPKRVLKGADLTPGDITTMRFSIADQDAVDLPAVLSNHLNSDEALLEKWNELTPGKQRAFAYRVSTAKTAKTIMKRVEEVVQMVREGLSYGKGGKVK